MAKSEMDKFHEEVQTRIMKDVKLNTWKDRIYVNGLSYNDKIWLSKGSDGEVKINYTKRGYGYNDAYTYIDGPTANDFFTAMDKKYNNIFNRKYNEVFESVQNGTIMNSRGTGSTKTGKTKKKDM